jgi:transmembrane sensor
LEDHGTNRKNYDEIIHRFFIYQATNEEICLLREWIKADPANKIYFDRYRTVWKAGRQARRLHEYQVDIAWNNLSDKLPEARGRELKPTGHRFITQRFPKVAALLLVAFISGILAVYLTTTGNNPLHHPPSFVVYTVPPGSKSRLILPDGSKVWLNSGSVLTYPLRFNGTTRDVYLEGEGFFDVRKNPGKPFSVKTTKVTVRVLGTAFNVKAYPDEGTTETTVERGLVQVTANYPTVYGKSKILIYPHQKAIYGKKPENNIPENNKLLSGHNTGITGNEEQLTIRNEINVNAVTSWKYNRWIIESEDLQSLAYKIERRYDVQIFFADKKLKDIIFTGSFEDETLEQVLKAIKMTAPIRYTIDRKKVILYEKKFETTQ